jgi:thymidylate synthase (FAD)
MKVELINYSQTPSTHKEKTMMESIAYCARVSNPSNQNNTETNDKLLDYLIKHQHWSPFEMASACLEIETTRDIARQILRHRSFSFQEFSQRYANPDAEFDDMFEKRERREQDPRNRQNSIAVPDEGNDWYRIQGRVEWMVNREYRRAIKMGIAKEQARALLPEGLTKSRMYMNGTIRSWIHYIELRSGNGTQKEHMDVAIACAKALEPIFPMIKDFVQPKQVYI